MRWLQEKFLLTGETTVAIAIKHLQEEIVAPSKYTPDLPYSLEQIILKCTQKSPERRYANMSALIDDLKHSLIDPHGDFVELAPLSAHAQTVMMTSDEMATVRQAAEEMESKPRYNYDNGDAEESYDDEDSTMKITKGMIMRSMMMTTMMMTKAELRT